MRKIIFVITLVAGVFISLIYFSNAELNIKQSEKKLFRIMDSDMTHESTLHNVDLASEHRLRGDRHVRQGHLELAVKEYEAAYSIDVGSRAVSGILLVKTYEKLNRYDDGIKMLNQMIKNKELSENGIKNANEMKARLVEAKMLGADY